MAAEARAAIAELERLEAHEGLARAWKLMMYVHFYEGRFSPAEECVSHAMRHAELAHDRVFEVRLLSALASCLVYSATPADEALERCRDLLERAAGDRRTEAMTLSAMSHLEAMRGEAEDAREHYRRSRAMLTDLGFTLSAAITSLHSGPAEVLAGDLERAEAELRADYETLQALGDTGYTPDRGGAARRGPSRPGPRPGGRGARGRSAARRRRPTMSVPSTSGAASRRRLLAAAGVSPRPRRSPSESVRLISTTDQPDVQGQALAGLAEVLEAAGKPAEAAASLRERCHCSRPRATLSRRPAPGGSWSGSPPPPAGGSRHV